MASSTNPNLQTSQSTSSTSTSTNILSPEVKLTTTSTMINNVQNLQSIVLQTIQDLENLSNTLIQTNPVSGSNKQIHTNINRVLINLNRIESNADITNNIPVNTSLINKPVVPIDLLEYLGTHDDDQHHLINNPDIWLQSKVQDLIQGEKIKHIQEIALEKISGKLKESSNNTP